MHFKLILIFIFLFNVTESSNILLMSLFRIHRHLFFELGHLLKEKQHDVYFLSYQNEFSVFQKQNFGVYIMRPDLNLSFDNREYNENIHQDLNLENARSLSTLNVLSNWCSLLFNESTLFSEIRSKHFDIFITDLFANDVCSIAWANKLEIPTIGIWPMSLSFPIAYHLSLPTTSTTEYGSSSFFQRLRKMIDDYFLMRKWSANYYQPTLQVINQYHNDTINLDDLLDQLVLIMTNENPMLELDKPALNHIVSIGGFHCKPPNPIPKNVEDFSKRFRSGIIFVSMDFDLLKKKEILTKTFSAFSSYAIIWQQNEKVENITNILTINTINQQDILGNPRTRLFISNCDSFGTTSAIFHGVPILCITKAAKNNIAIEVVDREIGFHIPNEELTDITFQQNTNKLLMDKRYYHNVRRLSLVFRDQPEVPSDRFVFWVEHVIRYKSAPLQAQKTRIYSSLYYYILDIIIMMLIFSLTGIGIVISISFLVTKILGQKMKGKVD